MKVSNSQATLQALASAIEQLDGQTIDPGSTEGRDQLLGILQELVEDPMKHRNLLKLLVSFNKPSTIVPKPWPKGAKPMLADTPFIPDEEDFYLEELHYGRVRKSSSESVVAADVGLKTPLSELMEQPAKVDVDFVSPQTLGFQDIEDGSSFNQRSLGIAWEQVENRLSVVWRQHPGFKASGSIREEKHSVDPDTLPIRTQQYARGGLRVLNNSRGKNSKYVKVDHEQYNIQVAFVASGEDLYVRVAVNERDVLAARESLSDTPHLASALVNALSEHPDAGLEIVECILEEYPSPRRALQRNSEYEP